MPPLPRHFYKAGVRRFPQLVMTDPKMEGVDISQKSQAFLRDRWNGESFMAIGMQDPVLGKDIMKELHTQICGCPEPLYLNEAGHFVPEWEKTSPRPPCPTGVSNQEIKKAGKRIMTDAVTKLVENYISSERYSGIEWRIAQRDDILSEGRVGYANFEQKSPIPEDAVYRIYSMTKPIISVLALMLIERGRLHLYDPLLAYDPRFRSLMVLHTNGAIEPANSPITVEHLLTHRAGFSYEFLLGCPIAPYYRAAGLLDNGARPFDDVMGALAELPLAFHPGSDWRYSVATDVLAHVIERATGERIDELLKNISLILLACRKQPLPQR